MRLAVCIKQVPDRAAVALDPKYHTLSRATAGAVLNPLDEFPLELALRLREIGGGEVLALTMGPPRAKAVLERALAMGADRGILLCDPCFAGADTWATSLTLARAVLKFGPFDLVLAGKQAVDGDTGQVGPGLAAQLDWPQATMVGRIRRLLRQAGSGQAAAIALTRIFEDGEEDLRLPLPAVLTVVKGAWEPRFGSLTGRLRARADSVETVTAAELGLARAEVGLRGSPTRVVRTDLPRIRRAQRRLTGSLESQVAILAAMLRRGKSSCRRTNHQPPLSRRSRADNGDYRR